MTQVAQGPLPPVYSVYASFGRRVLSFVIDFTLLSIVLRAAQVVTGAKFINFSAHPGEALFPYVHSHFGNLDLSYAVNYSLTNIGTAVFVTLWAVYFTLMEGGRQATIGKLIVRATVAMVDGSRITYSTALWRSVAKLISALTIIGFVMAGFTRRRQALHDLLAKTVVVLRTSSAQDGGFDRNV